jgi:CRISPR/Cas system CSM-associated protein Csm2 small subunit
VEAATHGSLQKNQSRTLQRDINIAFEVKDAYEKGATYEQAVLEVAENRGLSERQVKRIYAKIKKQASPSP